MAPPTPLATLGEEIQDPDEESFLLFSQPLPSRDLGMVDPKATTLDITIAGRDLTIEQSPSLLASSREGGTTGAVLWKLTPLFAAWLAWEGNWLFKGGFLSKGSTVLELGCGISGVVAMMLAPRVGRYVATDQGYVFKCLRRNLDANAVTRKVTSGVRYGKREKKKKEEVVVDGDVELLALDWESSVLEGMEGLLGFDGIGEGKGLDMVLACDCVYNEALIGPFVRTCRELCCLSGRMGGERKTLCVVAQQLRSHAVFEAWLKAFQGGFRVWRVPDEMLVDGLKEGSGYVVHVGVLRDGV